MPQYYDLGESSPVYAKNRLLLVNEGLREFIKENLADIHYSRALENLLIDASLEISSCVFDIERDYEI